jgi:hypothetical protein
MKPKDAEGLRNTKSILDPVILHLLGIPDPQADWDELKSFATSKEPEYTLRKFAIHLSGNGRWVPLLVFDPPLRRNITVVVFPEGKSASLKADGTPSELIAKLLRANFTCVVLDVTSAGVQSSPVPTTQPSIEFYAGYNQTLLGCRVGDILAAMRFASGTLNKTNIIGVRSAGPWCLLATAVARNSVSHTIVEVASDDFSKIPNIQDPRYLPLILRYGGIWPLASLGAPDDLTLFHLPNDSVAPWLKATYDAAGASDKLHIEHDAKPEDIVRWLQR